MWVALRSKQTKLYLQNPRSVMSICSLSLTYFYLLQSLRRLKWSEKELEIYQNKNVRRVVSYAYEHSPYYRAILQNVNLKPSEVKTIKDLNKIPITTKKDLKNTPIEQVLTNPNKKHLRKITTGGSTGQPFSIFIDAAEDSWRKANYMRANIACGQKPKDKWIAIVDEQYSNKTSLLQKIIGFYDRKIVPVNESRQKRLTDAQSLSPDVLDGFSSALYLLAKDYQKQDENSITPKLIFGSGELIDKHNVDYIKSVFDAPYFDQFGCTELDRTAWQCCKQQSYHMDTDSVVFQFVDENGNEVAPEEEGQIVYTSLFNYNFPIIRYNIKDIGVSSNESCTCGNGLPLMGIISGRSNDYLTINHTLTSPLSFIENLGAYKLEKEIWPVQSRTAWENYIDICC